MLTSLSLASKAKLTPSSLKALSAILVTASPASVLAGIVSVISSPAATLASTIALPLSDNPVTVLHSKVNKLASAASAPAGSA